MLDANADQLITYQSEEMPPISQPGDQILAMIAGDPSDPGGVFTAAKMIRDSDGKFRWESTAPNDAWAPEVGGKAVANLVSAKAASSTRLLKPGGN